MGRQDFSNQSVRTQDFAGASLAGADFSGADIRGARFADADLRGADFSRSRGGVPPLWAAAVVAGALLIASLVGVVAALATQAMAQRLESGGRADRLAVLVIGGIGITMIVIALLRNFRRAFLVGAIATVAVLTVAVPVLAFRGEFSPQTTAIGVIWLLAIVTAFTIGAVARASAGIISPIAFLVVAAVGALTARSAGGSLFAVLITVAAVILARRTLANPDDAGWLHTGSRKLVLRTATSFREANLTGANFTDAVTGPSDFTDARVSGANFAGASVTGRGKVPPDRLLSTARRDDSDPRV